MLRVTNSSIAFRAAANSISEALCEACARASPVAGIAPLICGAADFPVIFSRFRPLGPRALGLPWGELPTADGDIFLFICDNDGELSPEEAAALEVIMCSCLDPYLCLYWGLI